MRPDEEFLRHVIEEIGFLRRNSRGLTLEELEEDGVLKRAFARSFEVIGEAAKNLSDEFRKRHGG
ncbi:MAG: hypothetical protein MAG715_00988 [Methanonatronarchaeales archaeon]|nr:hypothetical protein [Methanonatronarchaeales archaeon]